MSVGWFWSKQWEKNPISNNCILQTWSQNCESITYKNQICYIYVFFLKHILNTQNERGGLLMMVSSMFFFCDAFRFFLSGAIDHRQTVLFKVASRTASSLSSVRRRSKNGRVGYLDLTHSSAVREQENEGQHIRIFFFLLGKKKGGVLLQTAGSSSPLEDLSSFFLGGTKDFGLIGLNHVESFILFCWGKPWYSWHQPHLRWFTQGPLVAGHFWPRLLNLHRSLLNLHFPWLHPGGYT